MSARIAEYHAEYFLPVVRNVLDPLLEREGFHYAGDHREVTAYWTAGDPFIRVGYLPETMPDYELLIGVGQAEGSPLQPTSPADSIGVWRLLPHDLAPRIADWRFHSPESLEAELRRAWDEVLGPYALPLLSEGDRLSQLIEEQNDELAEEEERLMDDRLLAFARAQFEAGRFAEAIHAYDRLRPDSLTRSDRKRLEIARRRL